MQLGASYKVAREATRRYEEGYEAAARFVGAEMDEIGEFGEREVFLDLLFFFDDSTIHVFMLLFIFPFYVILAGILSIPQQIPNTQG